MVRQQIINTPLAIMYNILFCVSNYEHANGANLES